MSLPGRRRLRQHVRPMGVAMLFVAAFLWFSYRASHAWLAAGYVDPVSRFGAQDESTYSRVVLEMLDRKSWMTPILLGRISFIKPPFLYWLDLISVNIFGASAFALRLPSVIAASGACAIAGSWVWRERGPSAALVTCILLASNYYWIVLSSLNMMDATVVFLSLAALYVISTDPDLVHRRTIVTVACVLGCAVLTKSVAPLPAFAAVAVYTTRRCVPARRVALIFSGAALIAAPWFTYACLSHPEWFWKEHVLTELLGHGVGGSPLGSPWANVAFYFGRLRSGDPVLTVLGAATIPRLFMRNSNKAYTLPLLWTAFTALTLMFFGFHAATYLLPLLTGAAILAGLVLPRLTRPWLTVAILILLAAETWKLVQDDRIIWSGTNLAMTPGLVKYCNQHRVSPLFIIEVDDEFFSAAQPLPHVTYGLLNQGRAAARLPIDFQSLGIIVTSEQYDARANLWPLFRERLDRIGLPRGLDPRATEVLFQDQDSIRQFIHSHAEIDFLVPISYADAAPERTRLPAGLDDVLLLSPQAHASSPSHPWSCAL